MALKVNDEVIDPSLLDQEFSSIKSYYESLAQVSCCERDDEFMGYAKENLIKRVLLAQEAEKRDLPVLKKEVDTAVEEMKQEQGGEAAFYAHTGISEEGEKMLRKDLGAKIRLDKFIDEVCGDDPTPSEAEILEYYQENLDDFKTEEEVRASHIFKSLRKSENRQEIYDELLAVRREALAGDDFDELAKKYSDKPAEEIDLGFFKRGEHMDEFETIAFSMEVDEISPIFSTHWGFHLAKLTDRKAPEPRPLAEIEETLSELMIREYRQEKVQSLAEDLMKTASVEDTDDGDDGDEEEHEEDSVSS